MPNILSRIVWNQPPIRVKIPICLICNEPVALENSKTNENGRAVHEECYLLKIGLKAAKTSSE